MEGAKSHQEQDERQEEQEEPGAKDEHKGSPSAHGWIHNSMAKLFRWHCVKYLKYVKVKHH